jgi:hypothetical protein
MKNIAIAIIASFGLVTAFAQAPAKADAPKTEMKLAKKKADKDKEDKAKKATVTKAKPATEPKK